MFDKGSEAWILLLAELGRMGRQPFVAGPASAGGGAEPHSEL
jgi:hypothetical protein